jgi:hypothetical protein
MGRGEARPGCERNASVGRRGALLGYNSGVNRRVDGERA